MLRSHIKNIGNFYCDISHCDVCKCFKWGNACYNMWYNRCCNNSYNFNLYCNRNLKKICTTFMIPVILFNKGQRTNLQKSESF